jgi:hypothetical protein
MDRIITITYIHDNCYYLCIGSDIFSDSSDCELDHRQTRVSTEIGISSLLFFIWFDKLYIRHHILIDLTMYANCYLLYIDDDTLSSFPDCAFNDEDSYISTDTGNSSHAFWLTYRLWSSISCRYSTHCESHLFSL